MTPPKCRICGSREHNHRCGGGTPASSLEERVRVRAREAEVRGGQRVNPPDPVIAATHAAERPDPPPKRRWHDDTDSAGEPTEVRDHDRRPARFYAPPGQCVYCDRRREGARRSMAAVRERGTDA
jgi:hypothetical protein